MDSGDSGKPAAQHTLLKVSAPYSPGQWRMPIDGTRYTCVVLVYAIDPCGVSPFINNQSELASNTVFSVNCFYCLWVFRKVFKGTSIN